VESFGEDERLLELIQLETVRRTRSGETRPWPPRWGNQWRATLTDYERRNLNNPTVVWRRWTADTRVKKPKPRSANVSGSEHGRAQAMIEQLQARVKELEEEIAGRVCPHCGKPHSS